MLKLGFPSALPCLDDLQERAKIHQNQGKSLCGPFDRLDHSYWSQDAIFGKQENENDEEKSNILLSNAMTCNHNKAKKLMTVLLPSPRRP